MNGPDSISDPVARRLRYTKSYPSARGLARLGSNTTRLNSARRGAARLESDGVAGGSHYADLSDDWTLTWHANCACWRHVYIMMTSSLFGSGTWVGSGQPIRAKKTRVMRGARLCAWPATPPERDGVCGHFQHPISTWFLPVASSLPPLHSGMVKTQFWQL
jgi:hypothetical protein